MRLNYCRSYMLKRFQHSHFLCYWIHVLLYCTSAGCFDKFVFKMSMLLSCWCISPVHIFIFHWSPFVLIQDCTIFKKSTRWRQCMMEDEKNTALHITQYDTHKIICKAQTTKSPLIWRNAAFCSSRLSKTSCI